MTNKQECVDILIQENMSLSQRARLVAQLDHVKGINNAWFDGNNHQHLVINYERAHISHVTLLDAIKLHGFHGDIINN